MTAARPVALITGMSGQDGYYLAKLLREHGYEVHGTRSRAAPAAGSESVRWHRLELAAAENLLPLLREVAPDEIYHLAGQSDVRLSFDLPLHTADVIALGTLRLLEAVRTYQRTTGRQPRLFHAATSEVFGQPRENPQTEKTPFHPTSPYGCAKALAFWEVVNYREAYGLFAVNGIFYNHESPRRGVAHVTRKITQTAARIRGGLLDRLPLGSLDARRDWGHARDSVEAARRMLQHPTPEDFIIATGETHSVREFLEEVFAFHQLPWQSYVEFDPALQRPAETGLLCGDASLARRLLGWQPTIGFKDLVWEMAQHDWDELNASSASSPPA